MLSIKKLIILFKASKNQIPREKSSDVCKNFNAENHKILFREIKEDSNKPKHTPY